MATVTNADGATLGRLFDSLSVLQSTGPDSPRVSRAATYIVVDPNPFASGPTFTGTGFTFDAAGRPTGGTVTAAHVPWYKVVPGYGVAGIEVPLTTLYAAALLGAGEALVPGVLGGNDTFLPEFRVAGTLHGYGGDDLFHVQLGPPVDGGAGMDTVVLSSFAADLRSNTTVEAGPGSLVVGRPDTGERVACASVEDIIAISAVEGVTTVLSVETVAARISVQDVIVDAPDEAVAPLAPVERVGAVVSVDGVVARISG